MYLGPKIFGVHKALFSAFSVETNREKSEACIFLIIWLVQLTGAAQAQFSVHHKYTVSHLRRAVYKKCTRY